MAAPRAEYDKPQRSRSRGRTPRSGGGTSLAGGKVKTGHRVHGMKDRDSDGTRSGRDGKESSSRARSKSRDRTNNKLSKPRKEYATPFDDKGRCHYHKNVQLAAKKQFGGGWKVLCNACPKCMEDGSGSIIANNDDSKSVQSGKSGRSGRSGKSSSNGGNKLDARISGDKEGGAGGKKFDNNGCCVIHSHIQVAKKKMMGGWKVMRTCPACEGNKVEMDDISVKSGKSARSASSRKSTRSTKSGKSTSKGKPGKATQSGRYGNMPFDGDGYCCRHPSVQIAQKKMIGGFKIIHDTCPECAIEDGVKSNSRGRSSSKGRNNRSVSRDRRRHSSRNVAHNDGDSRSSAGEASTKKKKRIRVKNLKTADEDGRPGKYSGYVNDDHQPHGNGTMRYENGDEWEGVWSEGSQVHGKMRRAKGESKQKKGDKN